MHNDSIETLLLRHYGHAAPTPPGLEQRLTASLRAQRPQQGSTTHLRRISRRQVIRLVAFGSAGLSIVSAGLESLHGIEEALLGINTTQQSLHSTL